MLCHHVIELRVVSADIKEKEKALNSLLGAEAALLRDGSVSGFSYIMERMLNRPQGKVLTR